MPIVRNSDSHEGAAAIIFPWLDSSANCTGACRYKCRDRTVGRKPTAGNVAFGLIDHFSSNPLASDSEYQALHRIGFTTTLLWRPISRCGGHAVHLDVADSRLHAGR